MLFSKPKTITVQYVIEHLLAVVGIVLVWRGVWYVLDEVDQLLFAGHHIWTAIGGIVLGMILLYLPDKDLKELSQH